MDQRGFPHSPRSTEMLCLQLIALDSSAFIGVHRRLMFFFDK
jgi:hypothetical protein